MGFQGNEILRSYAERGPVDAWDRLSRCLSLEGMYAVQLDEAVHSVRSGAARTRRGVADVFQAKAANLGRAESLLTRLLEHGDRSRFWGELDERAGRLDLSDLAERWAGPIASSPASAWGTMRRHGVRAFCETTAVRLIDLHAAHARWVGAWDAERRTGHIDHLAELDGLVAAAAAQWDAGVRQRAVHALLYLPDE
ncbi:hypothetical protein AB0L06_09600 [Spirillospora sp. NPDC052269]